MAPPSLSTAMPQRPDDRTIAFAISIVLSKPEDVSIRGKSPIIMLQSCVQS